MQNKLTTEELTKRLKELDILENKEKTELNTLHEKLGKLDILENKEKEKLENLKKQQEKEIKKTFERIQPKKTETEKKYSPKRTLVNSMATLWLATLLGFSAQKVGILDNKKQDKEEIKKEIIIADEWKKIETISHNDTAVVDRNTGKLVETPIVKEKTTPISTTKKTVNINNTAEDEVFTSIETIQPDPNDNSKNTNDRYSDRKSLSWSEKSTVKAIYKNITTTQDKTKIAAIIDELDIRILLWLNDICIKKSFLLKKAGKTQELEKMRVITQQIMTKKNEIVSTSKGAQTVETIKNIQKMINQYTIQPNTFTIEKTKGERVFDYSGDESKSLMERVKAINFTIKKNGKELGIISFDVTGKLLTQYIIKDSQTYTISQNRTTIQVTEGYVVSN